MSGTKTFVPLSRYTVFVPMLHHLILTLVLYVEQIFVIAILEMRRA